MASKKVSSSKQKKLLSQLSTKEKDLRVEIVHIRELLLFSESQFFYRLFHFFKYVADDLKSIVIKKGPPPSLPQKKSSSREKIKELESEIAALTAYRNKLMSVAESPFIFFVLAVKSIQYIYSFIPNLVERSQVEQELIQTASFPKASDIINFGVIPYHFRRLRQQHLAEGLAKQGKRVFYIENRFLPQGKGQPLFQIRKEIDNVFIVSLSCTRDIAIYHQVPTNAELKSIVKSFKTFLKEAHICRPTAKIDYPFWAYLLPYLNMPVVYDCMDDYEGFAITGSHILDLEKQLIKKAELTVVCSDLLKKKILKHKPRKLALIKNACEFDHFAPGAIKKDTCSAGLCWIRKPVIGFFGAIGEWIDAPLIEKIAKSYPTMSVVMIGEVRNPAMLNVGERLPNVFLIGEKPYVKLPEYLQTFDICIIPFAINKHTELIDPVKLYEYLAAGKPVVTSAITEIAKHKKLIYYSLSHEQFLYNIKKALKEKGKTLVKKRQDLARKNTWSARTRVLDRQIQTLQKDLYNRG